VRAVALAALAVAGAIAALSSCKPKGTRAAPAESTGVAECDDYAARYEACLERRGADEREEAEQSFAAQRSALKLNAGTPEDQRALAEQCKAALEAIKPLCGG
jgi:hypothetical protein